MSLLKLAHDVFKKESGVWLDFDRDNGLKVLPTFNPKVTEALLSFIEKADIPDEVTLAAYLAGDKENAKRFVTDVIGAAIVDWRGMSIDKDRAETAEEVLENLKDPRFDHLTGKTFMHMQNEDNFRPDVEPTERDIVKN